MSENETVYEGEVVDDDGAPEPSEVLALDPITRAEIDMQIATAKRFPRDLTRVKKDMVAMAALDEETAESCFYSLSRRSRNGKTAIIQGPSIRMAEIALSCFGNVRAGTRSLGETEDGRFVRELGVCHDVQNNVMVAREVKRRITTREGRRYGDDMIGTTMAAAGSIALRNAVLTVVPRALVKPAFEKARDVAAGKTKSLTARRGEVIERLQKLSPLITVEAILGAVEKANLEEIGWPEIEHLIGLGTAIKDGVQTVEEAFPDPGSPPEGATTAAEILDEDDAKEEAPEQGPDADEKKDPNAKLAPGVITRLRALAEKMGVPIDDVEGHFGDNLKDLPADKEAEIEAEIRERGKKGKAKR